MGDTTDNINSGSSPENGEKKDIAKKALKIFLDYKWILLLLIVLAITVTVRLEPEKLVPLEKSAEATVNQALLEQMKAEMKNQYPNLPDTQINDMAATELNKYKLTQEYKDQVKQGKDMIKSRFEYESGNETYTYLGDIDSYYWIRQSRNILEKGDQCDMKKDGRCFDTYTTAPVPRGKGFDLYPVVIVDVYKFLKIFEPDMSIMQASFLTPLFISLFITVFLFLLLRRIAGDLAAFFGTVLINVNPYVLSRTLGSDSDIMNILFQALFLWLAIECFYSKKPLHKYIWGSLTALSLVFYSFFWAGWWYLADLFILSLILSAAYIVLKNWYNNPNKKIEINEVKKPLMTIGILLLLFVVIIGVLFSLLTSVSNTMHILGGQFSILHFKIASNTNYWPNVLTTVAEFNSIGLPQIIGSFGSSFTIPIFFMAILGMIFLIFPNIKIINKNILVFALLLIFNLAAYIVLKSTSNGKLVFLLLIPLIVGIYVHMRIKEEEFNPESVFLLIIMICLITYFTMTGVRFLFLMVIPVCIFASVFLTKASTMIVNISRKTLSLPKQYTNIIVFFILVIFLIAPVKAGFKTAQEYVPQVTDEWVATLEKINKESKPDAIINSWWDFGHWFKYLADRRVTLDGSSQNSPQLHWLGKLLLTSDEKTCIGILRMLDCGGNSAVEEINKKMNDTPHSVDIVNKIIILNKTNATGVLMSHGFSEQEAAKVLQYTHCDPPENFLITSEDMIGKSGVWAHFGSWNFKRSYLNGAIKTMPKEEIIKKFAEDYNIPQDQTVKMMNELNSMTSQDDINAWIAPWPGYYTTGLGRCTNKGNISVCRFSNRDASIDVEVDFEKKEMNIMQEGQVYHPKRAAFVYDNTFYSMTYMKDTIELGVVVEKRGDAVAVLFTSPELAGSMFTRLFFFEGAGLENFDKFYDTTTPYGDRIITWKVKWPDASQ